MHLRSEAKGRQEEPSAAAIAQRLGIAESAVLAVREVQRTRLSSLDPAGSEDNPYEDVQLAQELDRINASHLEASGGSSLDPARNAVAAAAAAGATGGGVAVGNEGGGAEGYAATEVALHRLDALLKGVMKEREAWVLRQSMGLGREGGDGISTYVLAEELGMSRQGVDRLRNKALERLREACRQDAQLAQTLEEVCLELG